MTLFPFYVEGSTCRAVETCHVTHVVFRPDQTALLRIVRNEAEIVCEQVVEGMHARNVRLSISLSPGEILHLESEPETPVTCHWYVRHSNSLHVGATVAHLAAELDAAERAAGVGETLAEQMYPTDEGAIAAMFENWAAAPTPGGSECIGAPTAHAAWAHLPELASIDQLIATRKSHTATPPKPRPTRKVRLGPTAAEPTARANPYLAEFNESVRGYILTQYASRDRLVRKYAWAVPNDAALDALGRLGPIVEVGAGTGYWAKLLQDRGVDVRAFDAKGETRARYCDAVEHTTVELGGPEVLSQFPDRTLFLCWPPLGGELVDECLRAYAGSTLVLVGEGENGCTGFSDQLTEQWDEVERVGIPQWRGLHDYLGVWRKR